MSGKTPGLLCICRICTCGRHRCIHHPKLENKPIGQCVFTEYKDTYRKFPTYEQVHPIKPASATKISNEPFDVDTSYRQNYIAHQVKPHTKREQAKYIKPIGKVDGTSNYRCDFTEKFVPKIPSARPPYRPSTADQPFSGTTVHKETYKPWELEIRQGIRPPPAIKLPTGKFEHQTTFQDDFKGHKGTHAREAIHVPPPALSITPGKFANETTTRKDFTAKSQAKEKSARPSQSIVKHAGPFSYKTTCQSTYMWHAGRPASSCRPPEKTHLSKDPLNCDTTHNLTYKAWGAPKTPGLKPKNGWSAPTDPFDHQTTCQHDFDGKLCEPAKSARPDYRRINPGEFDGLTTHKKEYKCWEVGPRESFKPHESYTGPTPKFDGQTMFQTDFKAAQAIRPPLCIPKEGGIKFNGDHDFRTMYRDTYLGERPTTCPAKLLDMRIGNHSKTGHTYRMDLNGHQYFSYNDDKEKHVVPPVQLPMNAVVEVVG